MTSKTVIQHVARTHPGRVRDHNEDCYHADNDAGLFIVADGMGGMEAGEVASAIARDETVRAVNAGHPLPEAIQLAHEAIRKAVDEGVGAPGMGTTIVALKMMPYEYHLAWVGDSRAYLWDAGKGSLRRLSRDHSHVELLLSSGVISPEQAHKHPQKNLITQCLGQSNLDTLQVGETRETLAPGQTILLCSDGLNDELTDTEIAQCLVSQTKPDAQADALLQATLEKGAKDNVTILLVQLEGKGWLRKLRARKSVLYALSGMLLGIIALGLLKTWLGEIRF